MNPNATNSKSLKWFSFYKYFFLPITIIISLANIFYISNILINFFIKTDARWRIILKHDLIRNYFYIAQDVLNVILLIISIFLLIGFIKNKKWAYKLIFIFLITLLIVESFAIYLNIDNSFQMLSFIILNLLGIINFSMFQLSLFSSFVFMVLVIPTWILPNWIYFKKRKNLFNN